MVSVMMSYKFHKGVLLINPSAGFAKVDEISNLIIVMLTQILKPIPLKILKLYFGQLLCFTTHSMGWLIFMV